MMQTPQCPRCHQSTDVEQKLLLAGMRFPDEEYEKKKDMEGNGKWFKGTIPANVVKDEYFEGDKTKQFLNGYFCRYCQVGFLPDEFLKEP